MNENKVIKDIDQQIDQLRNDKTLFGNNRDIFGKDFKYSKLDEKILSWEKFIKYHRWLADITTGILLIASFIQVYQNTSDEPIDYLSKGAGFVIASISILITYLVMKSDLEKAKMIKYLIGLKDELED